MNIYWFSLSAVKLKSNILGILAVGWTQQEILKAILHYFLAWRALVQRENNLQINRSWKWSEMNDTVCEDSFKQMLWLIFSVPSWKQDNMRMFYSSTRSTQSSEKLVSHPAAPDFRRQSGDKMLELQAFTKEEEQSGFCFHSYPLNLRVGLL